MPTTLRLPYDIYFGTTGADCADPDGRMHLARRVQRDPTAGRETTHVFDLLGNASTALALPATRGTAYPAAALVWDGPRAGTVSIGTREPVPVDAWLRKGSSGRAFLASDSRTYRWTYAEREGAWKCLDDAGLVVAEGTDDQYRTLALDQTRPHLGVEILVSFLIMHRLTARA